MLRSVYWLASYIGLMSFAGAFIWGFRYDAGAPMENYGYNALLYLAYIVIHLIMTRPWFKKIAYGSDMEPLRGRQIFIIGTILTWGAVLYLHKAVPGPSYAYTQYATFIEFFGLCAVLLAFFAFLEGQTFGTLNSFLGMPGAELSHSHSVETPLLTEGSYAQVRHPMYRAVFFLGGAAMLLHPNVGQLLWTGMVGATFIFFIPIEEATLKKYRGEDYQAYMRVTRYRLFKGIW